jgi:hypothetical protein
MKSIGQIISSSECRVHHYYLSPRFTRASSPAGSIVLSGACGSDNRCGTNSPSLSPIAAVSSAVTLILPNGYPRAQTAIASPANGHEMGNGLAVQLHGSCLTKSARSSSTTVLRHQRLVHLSPHISTVPEHVILNVITRRRGSNNLIRSMSPTSSRTI